MQYTYLLTSQLESQRLYFEEKMENVERQSQRQVYIITACLSGILFCFISSRYLSLYRDYLVHSLPEEYLKLCHLLCCDSVRHYIR